MDEPLKKIRDEFRNHPLLMELGNSKNLTLFLEQHAICVWDYMSLLKSLQSSLTCINVPWSPAIDPSASRVINELVLKEESEVVYAGIYQSHLEIYLDAMREIGCAMDSIEGLMKNMRIFSVVDDAIEASSFSAAAKAFTSYTMSITRQPLHIRAAVFFHAREQFSCVVFPRISEILAKHGLLTTKLNLYFSNHGDQRAKTTAAPSKRLLGRLCGIDVTKRVESEKAALHVLELRKRLWDDLYLQTQVKIVSKEAEYLNRIKKENSLSKY